MNKLSDSLKRSILTFCTYKEYCSWRRTSNGHRQQDVGMLRYRVVTRSEVPTVGCFPEIRHLTIQRNGDVEIPDPNVMPNLIYLKVTATGIITHSQNNTHSKLEAVDFEGHLVFSRNAFANTNAPNLKWIIIRNQEVTERVIRDWLNIFGESRAVDLKNCRTKNFMWLAKMVRMDAWYGALGPQGCTRGNADAIQDCQLRLSDARFCLY